MPFTNEQGEVRFSKPDIANKLSAAVMRLAKGSDGTQEAAWHLLEALRMIEMTAPAPGVSVNKLRPVPMVAEAIAGQFGIRRSAIGEKISGAILKVGEERWVLAVMLIWEALLMLQRVGAASNRTVNIETVPDSFRNLRKERN